MNSVQSSDLKNGKIYSHAVDEFLKKNYLLIRKDEYIEFPNTCGLCFKVMTMYAIGICNHPICLECSVRMRLLHNKLFCAICQTFLPRVICSSIKLLYQKLEIIFQRENLCYQMRGIGFYNVAVEREFYHLIENSCSYCNVLPFNNISFLDKHLYEVHSLIVCILCVTHLKKFPSERQVYTKASLEQHWIENHPRCNLCLIRFFDNSELFFHMKRTHYWCHICVKTSNFYQSYAELQKHVSEQHLINICGNCVQNQFNNCFNKGRYYQTNSVESHKIQSKETKEVLCGTEVASILKQQENNTEHNNSLIAKENINYANKSIASLIPFPDLQQILQSKNSNSFAFLKNRSVETMTMPQLQNSIVDEDYKDKGAPLTTVSSLNTDNIPEEYFSTATTSRPLSSFYKSLYPTYTKRQSKATAYPTAKQVYCKTIDQATSTSNNHNKNEKIISANLDLGSADNEIKNLNEESNMGFTRTNTFNKLSPLQSHVVDKFCDNIVNSNFPDFPPQRFQNSVNKQTQTDPTMLKFTPSRISSTFICQNNSGTNQENIQNYKKPVPKFTETDFPSFYSENKSPNSFKKK
ncbi:uncharacterized protein LOC119676957 [Teleopsis dalmanni]|uniref:uncharacterized protein LOC119676957 n=1 Tax=Teleopsis dalmanni TaxID=139649 RepID=UPI0018CD29BF|nr:uncharacterized protein LOC119676957 [Teleopsis dalmanni]